MEQNYNPYTNPTEGGTPNQYQRIIVRPNYFEFFAHVFAVASLLSCTVIYVAYIFAGLAILFALLSRGSQMKFSPRAKRALIFAAAAIIVATVLFVGSFLFLLEEYGSIEGILREGSEMIGLDFEKEFGYLFE